MSPFVSEAQRKYLWAKKPDIAREFAHKTSKGKKLPKKKRNVKDIINKATKNER